MLFLDEVSEFSRGALEALRQPLEDGSVTIVRGQRTARFPTRFMLAAATNPCPCGSAGDLCRCTEADLARHRRRLSGPLLDRLDLLVAVHRPSATELATSPLTTSAQVAGRVAEARACQERRLGPGTANAHASSDTLSPGLRPGAKALLREVYEGGVLSARGHTRVLRVARTIADLAGAEAIATEHLLEAFGLRQQVADGPVGLAA